LALSSDGRLLLAGGGRGDLRFFDLERDIPREPQQAGFPHAGYVEQVAFLPGARRAVSLDAHDGRCLIWEVGGDKIPGPKAACDLPASLLSAATQPGGAGFALLVRDKAGRQSVRLFDPEGRPLHSFEPPGPSEKVTAMDLSDKGKRVVLGTESGRVVDLDIQGHRNRPDRSLKGGAVKRLMIQPLRVLAGAGNSLHVLPEKDGPATELPLGEPIEHVAASSDGQRVAACGAQGLVRAWAIPDDGGSPAVIELGRAGRDRVVSLAFSPGGETLVAGEVDGRIRSWTVPAGEERPAIAPDPTGRIGHVAVAPDGEGKALLQVSWDARNPASGRALIWRFGEETGARPVPGGPFQPVGGFLPGDRGVVLLDARGDVVVHRLDTLERRLVFTAPTAEGGAPAVRGTDAASLAISANGRRVAVGSGEWAVVWTADNGEIAVKPFRAHDDKVRAVALSADGRLLITAGDDGHVKLWDVAGAQARFERELSPVDPDAAESPRPVTAAAFSPADAKVFALGRDNGRIELWNPELDQKPARAEPMADEVKSLVFSPDGRLLAAAGDDRRITIVPSDRPTRRVELVVRPDSPGWPQHSERINALAFWPNGRQLASASHDATIRLWRLKDEREGSLLGTMAGSSDGADWVVFTPQGLYDGSAAGERRVTWRLDPRWWTGEGDGLVARLDQLGRRFRFLDLADRLSEGNRPEPPIWDNLAPPRVVLEPVVPPSPARREVAVRARLSEKADLRIYHNGIPVPADLRSVQGGGSVAEATVTLIGGKKNRIYAMASRGTDEATAGSLREPASIDGLSNILDLEYDRPTPGTTHVLALGISNYRGQPLRFAHEDAQSIAEFLGRKHRRGAQRDDKPPIVLVNEKVTRGAIATAFEDLRARVRRHPEDTVVIFLAGHTTLNRGRFCLLMPNAPLPDRPLGQEELALRAPIGPETFDEDAVLQYRRVDFNLSQVDALQRVVIVDACESEAIFDDIRNRGAFRQYAEQDARVARTSYILATRRGEREAEAPVLQHGLLTYTLLRGMGQPGLRPPRPDLEIFQKLPNADLDHNGWIETAELQEYARRTIPALAERFPGLLRGPGPGRGGPEPSEASSVLSRSFDRSGSFPLVEVPGTAGP
jgi:WD40 repeat protein